MRAKRPTRQDVATKAGVAPSTVTLILNQKGEGLGIPETTRVRVETAARELGYYPNWHIRSIRSGSTGNLGLYLRAGQWGKPNGYWSLVLACLQRAVAEADLRLLVHGVHADCPTEEAFARQAGGVVDGVIIINSGNDPIAQRLMETGLPAVELGDIYSALPLVAVNGAQGIRLVVRHLWERGYKRPAFCWDSSPYLLNAQSRECAFYEFACELFRLDRSELRSLEISEGPDRFAELWSLTPRPDCVVCTSDELAFSLLESALAAGVDVPNELGITGFDCIPAFAPIRILTSVQTPLEQMARDGVSKLLALIDGKSVESSTVLPVRLREGTSTRKQN
jgi:DNA-binding LacI/PurR family transcriptional regulator